MRNEYQNPFSFILGLSKHDDKEHEEFMGNYGGPGCVLYFFFLCNSLEREKERETTDAS